MDTIASDLLLADRIWLAVAMLQQQFPDMAFSRTEIREKLAEQGLDKGTNPASVNAHLKQHLVANVPPSTGKYTMLFETKVGFLRLFRPGDPIDPHRRSVRGSKSTPRRERIPPQYHPLLDWYDGWKRSISADIKPRWEEDPLIQLIGSGKHIWADEHADEYVENLRREDI